MNKPTRKPSRLFRANAAAMIVKDGKVLACQRIDHPENWQCPQGGIDVGDTPEEAVWREVQEEVGLTMGDVRLVAKYPEWLTYEYVRTDGDYFGQTQRWYVFLFTGDESTIVLDPHEFQDWVWMDPDELIEKVPPMKRGVLEKVVAWLQGIEI